MIQAQCELCKAQGIAKFIPPSQAKAHKMRMHPEAAPNPALAPTAVTVMEPPAQEPNLPASEIHLEAAVITLPLTELNELPVSAPKRRGRPSKFGVAMTVAERKAASRAWQKEKQQDAERREIVAEILIIARRNLSKPGGDNITVLGEQRIESANREYLKSLHENLLHQSVDDLRKSLQALKEHVDSHGRLHGERSGEAEQSMGQSEMETLDAARRHDTGLFEVDDPEVATAEAKQMAAGFRVKPEGAGPDTFDKPEDDEADKHTGGSPRPNWTPTADEKWLDKAITSIVHKLNLKFVSDTRQCPFCTEIFLVPASAVNHFEEQYGKDVRAYEKWRSFGSALYQMHLTTGGPLVSPGLPPKIPHCWGIEEEIELLRKQARKKPKKAA